MWLKNTAGKADAMLTLSVVTLGTILFKFLFSEMSVGPVTFGQLDGAVIAALLAPTLGSYCARRYTDTVNPKDSDESPK